MSRTTDPFYFFCPHCGRQWNCAGMSTKTRSWQAGDVKTGANTGFVAAASDMHSGYCADKTPAQRRAANRAAEQRWAKATPTACRIWNNPSHPGLIDASAPNTKDQDHG